MIMTTLNCPQCEGEGVAAGVECPSCGGTGEVEANADTELNAMVDATRGAMANELQPAEDPVTQALAVVTQTNTSISQHLTQARELHARYKDVAFDVRSTKGMEAAKNARLMLRQERYPIQTLKKAGSKLLGQMQRQFNARCDEGASEIEGYEEPIDAQITAEETRKEAERTEREATEQRRRQGHIDAIAAMHRMVTDASSEDSSALELVIDGAQKIVIDEGYEEYQGQAQQAKDEVLRQLQGMLIAARAEEAELEETKRQQAALKEAQEKLAAQQKEMDEREATVAAQQRQLAEQRNALEAEQAAHQRAKDERAQAVESRIEQFNITAARYSHMAASVDLRSAIATMHDTLITEAMFDGRTSEAQKVKAVAIGNLRELLSGAEAREAEEARQQQAARVQEMIDSIVSMGRNATLAVEDGSADVTQLQNGLHNLEQLDLSQLVGGRLDEANAARQAAIASTKVAIAATEERYRLRAEKEERQRHETAVLAAAWSLADAKRLHGEELYEHLRALIKAALELSETCNSRCPEAEAARALLLKINPNETFKE